jgi:phage terminase small subunit
MADEKLRKKIERAIIKQLKEKSIYQYAHYQDLVNDYMKMWDVKNMLQEDIEERGVSVYWCNGGGQEGYKKNESISELVKVNKQMLKILLDLGIRASDLKAVEPDDEL